MSDISVIPDLLVSLVKDALPDFAECGVHSGQFSKEDIARLRKSAPSFNLSVPIVDVRDDGGIIKATLEIAAVLCTKERIDKSQEDKRIISAQSSALAALTKIGAVVSGGEIAEGVYAGRDFRAKDFSDFKSTQLTEGVWVLNWAHDVMILPDEIAANFDGILYSHAPNVGPDHIDDYKSIEDFENDL